MLDNTLLQPVSGVGRILNEDIFVKSSFSISVLRIICSSHSTGSGYQGYLLPDIEVQSANLASSSFLLVKKFFSGEVTIKFPFSIIGHHHDFVKVFGTNFVVHQTHLVWTTTELNFAIACQFCFAFFASDSNHCS